MFQRISTLRKWVDEIDPLSLRTIDVKGHSNNIWHFFWGGKGEGTGPVSPNNTKGRRGSVKVSRDILAKNFKLLLGIFDCLKPSFK